MLSCYVVYNIYIYIHTDMQISTHNIYIYIYTMFCVMFVSFTGICCPKCRSFNRQIEVSINGPQIIHFSVGVFMCYKHLTIYKPVSYWGNPDDLRTAPQVKENSLPSSLQPDLMILDGLPLGKTGSWGYIYIHIHLPCKHTCL